jgi:DNA replication and repair protein RecF
VQIGSNNIRAHVGDFVFTSKLVDGRFPDYRRVLPKNPDKTLEAGCDSLKQAFARAAILSNEKFRGVRLYVSENQIKITANNPEQEEAEEILDVTYAGAEMEIGFNVSYVLDVLNALKCENVRILLTDSVSSVQIEDAASKARLCCHANETVMSLTRLLIRDFRNIESADLALSPGFNFLVGANGSGKTSVLEAIYTLGHGRAFRSLQIGRVIRHEQESLFCTGVCRAERETAIGLTKDKQGDSKVRIDGTDGHKVAELALLMPMQLITPEGFTLLNGGPKYRRAFLDWGCFHNEAGFFNAWSNLKRLLKQRNAALRQVTRYAQLRPWDMELIPLAEQISRWRAEYSAGIAEDMADTCKQFLPEFSLTFSFQRGWEKETDYAEVLERSFERDRMLTYTAHGPHKADFRIRADGAPVEDTCRAGSSSS